MDTNTEVWARTATGKSFHLFAEGRFTGAACRSNIRHAEDAELKTDDELAEILKTVWSKAEGLAKCSRCATAFANLVARDAAPQVPTEEPPAGAEATAHFTDVPPVGTRVMTTRGPGEVIDGSGVVRDDHPNAGLVWVEIMLDPTAKIPWHSRTREFLVELKPEAAPQAPAPEESPQEPTLADEAAAIPVEEPVLNPLETEFMDLLANGVQINNAGRMVGLDSGEVVQLLRRIENALSAKSAWHAVAIFAARRAYSRGAALVAAEGADAHGKLDALVRIADLHI